MKSLVASLLVLAFLVASIPTASAQSLTDAFFQREDVRYMLEQFVYFGLVIFLMAIGLFVLFMKKEKLDFSKLRQQAFY